MVTDCLAGIGLAAPQLGILQRLIVLDCEKEEGATPRPTVMFNPEILAVSDETNVYDEGCLSIPEQFGEVTRPAEVQIRWIDADGDEKEAGFDGLWATCVQHEIDHLNGVLFIDKKNITFNPIGIRINSFFSVTFQPHFFFDHS